MDCSNIQENKKTCTCPEEDCERHGKCCECVRYHKSTSGLPMCLR